MLWRYAIGEGGRAARRRAPVRPRQARPDAARERGRPALPAASTGPRSRATSPTGPGSERPHARRLWDEVEGDLAEIDGAWLLAEDVGRARVAAGGGGRALPAARRSRTSRSPTAALLAPDRELHKRLFRPVASPGVVLKDGRLAGLWRAKAKGRKTEITVEKLGRLARRDLADEAQRVAELRGSDEAGAGRRRGA